MSPAIVPPPPGRWRRFGLAVSVLALALLVVVVPVGLIIIGGAPFAHTGISEAIRSLSSSRSHDPHVATNWITGGALALAWLAWGWLVLCIVVELRSWVTGRSPVRLPASRTAQSAVALLVGTVLTVSAVGRTTTAPGSRATVQTPAWVTDSTIGLDDVVPMSQLIDAGRAGPLLGVGPETLDLPIPADGDSALPSTDPMPGVADADAGADAGADGDIGLRPVPMASPSRWPGDKRPDVLLSGPLKAMSGPTALVPIAVPRTHLVRPRETLWSIAADELGSSLRWQELAELNIGIRQADGGTLDHQNWITPGWRLLLPPIPTSGQAPPVASTQSVVFVRPDDVVGPATELDPTDEPADPGAIGDDRSGGGEGDRPAPVRSLGPLPIRLPFGPAAPPVVPVGGGIVGAGVVRVLDRMRRVQQRHRRDNTFIRLPGDSARRFEQRLRVGENRTLIGEVDEAIRLIAGSVSRAGVEPPVVTGVRIHEEAIDVVLDTLEAIDDEALEQLSDRISVDRARGVVVVDRTDGSADPVHDRGPSTPRAPRGSPVGRAPAPLLATIGRGPTGPVLVNLEALGSLVLRGDPEAAEAVVRGLAVELATSYWSGQFSVCLVGFGSELERFEGVASFADVSPLTRQLCRRRITGVELLRSTGRSSFAQARLVEASETWDPLAVICGPEVSDSDVAELFDVASDPTRGMVVIAVGERIEARHSVRLTGDEMVSSLELLGSVVFPQRIEPDELDGIGSLLDTAANRQSVLSSEEPYVNLPIPLPHSRAEAVDLSGGLASSPVKPLLRVPAAPTETGHRRINGAGSDGRDAADVNSNVGRGKGVEVEVAVLGSLEIRGAARDFTRAWALELVVYLALHPRGATNETWATALWPDRLMAPSTLHSTASVARRSLGRAEDGSDHLPRSHGRLSLAPTVGTDWYRFVALADSERPEHWRTALELVRGRPFEGLRSSDWPILEGIGPAIEAAVVDLSGRLAGAYLRMGDASAAEWAARKGLVVSPYDERLYRMLMRAADLGGNPAGVDAVMAELIKLVADDIEPLDAVHPSTMDLYRQLSRRRRFSPEHT